ncbi:hypothetical protein PV760_11085 [Paenarthrobacter sp. CC6]|uniref:hypothetical protein n=1 Tax=Paenarthrobacter sp. CC6 TaxID=3029184 RepID=UPI00339D232F
MKRRGVHLLWLLLPAAAMTNSCGAACDTAMRFSILDVDLSSVPGHDPLEFIVEGLDRANQDACTANNSGKRFDAGTESSVPLWLGVKSVRITVFVRGTTQIAAMDSLDPIPWDPPIKQGPGGPTPSHANWKPVPRTPLAGDQLPFALSTGLP